MVTVETIEMEINYIKGEIEEIKKGQDKILETLNKLDDRYPTRREFNAVKWVVSILGWILGLATTILALKGI